MNGRSTRHSGEIGHVVLGDQGQMLGLDAGFCAIMRSSADAMVGRGVLEFTVPDDRERCRIGMGRLRATGRAFTVSKRMLRGDRSSVWVEQATTLVQMPGTSTIVATFRPIAEAPSPNEPAALLLQARFLGDSGATRRDMLGSIFANPAWDLLLQAYIAEAEGRMIDLSELARAARTAPDRALRWARALAGERLLEVEEPAGEGREPAYRLTMEAHARLEAYLSERLCRLTGVGSIARELR